MNTSSMDRNVTIQTISFRKFHKKGFNQGVGLLTNFIDYASEQYPLDKSQFFLLGFSQGAVMSMTLALTLGNRIKGIVALSGYIPTFAKEEYRIKSVDQLSAFIAHGRLDQVLPYEWGVSAQEYFNSRGASISFHTYQEGHTVSFENQQDFKEWLISDCKN
ncbi:alpha/beta hydrolase [Bacillus sp. V3B]|uniref:alpha/beta hydrolase n=1 Tax=Bacillus sp. V3B TaxID=2804915 RepID=UPI002108B5C9|nr:dienelactone hydrolase family protein [Bacillus sp. V3B]